MDDDNIHIVLSFPVFVSSRRTNCFQKPFNCFTVGKMFKYVNTFPASSMVGWWFTGLRNQLYYRCVYPNMMQIH